MHSLDARSKIILALCYSVSLFFIDTWVGMGIATLLFLCVLFLSKLPLASVFRTAVPVYVIVAFTIVFNMFPYEDGSVGFSESGLLRGAFFALRILLLVWITMILCFSTTSTALTDAITSFLSPLRKLKVPVDDIAMVFSIAIRFIPQIMFEYATIRDAQWARGASFESGGIVARVKAHCVVLLPLVVALFRRADSLAYAMDARCYGMPGVTRTSITATRISTTSVFVAVTGCALCIAIACFL